MTLNVAPADVVAFADRHDIVATQVQSDATADAATQASMASAFGPAGAAFTAALQTFQTALEASGTQISGSYRDIGGALRASAQTYVTTDNESGRRFTALKPTTIV